jgi:hypothetical protein
MSLPLIVAPLPRVGALALAVTGLYGEGEAERNAGVLITIGSSLAHLG